MEEYSIEFDFPLDELKLKKEDLKKKHEKLYEKYKSKKGDEE